MPSGELLAIVGGVVTIVGGVVGIVSTVVIHRRTARKTPKDIQFESEPTASPAPILPPPATPNPITQIIFTRPQGPYRDRTRAYDLIVDGIKRAVILPGETITVPVAAGPHRVRAKIDWSGSQEMLIDVTTGSEAQFLVGPAGGVGSAVFHVFSSDRWIRLSFVGIGPSRNPGIPR